MKRKFLCWIAALAVGAHSANAQQVPVVLVHGFLSGGQTWEVLHQLLTTIPGAPYQVRIAELPPLASFDHQAETLVSELDAWGFTGEEILIGHSQGGLISRLASKDRPVRGIISIGSPHRGAPAAENGKITFKLAQLTGTWGAMHMFADAVPRNYDNMDFWDAVDVADEGFAYWYGGGVAATAILYDHLQLAQLAVGLPNPIPGETAATRISIVNSLDEGYNSGPLRLRYDGPTATQMGNDIYWHGLWMFRLGFGFIYDFFTGSDYWVQRECTGGFMIDLGWEVSHLGSWWSYDVVGSDEHDGLVPTYSQEMPVAGSIFRIDPALGMSHVEETSRGASTILLALRVMTGTLP